jgi:superfamily II RNA helicase
VSLLFKFSPQIPVEINTEFAGLVEAWAAGVTWKDLMDDSEMDEGDVARLLRRSIDLLAQVKSHMTNLCLQTSLFLYFPFNSFQKTFIQLSSKKFRE